MFFDKNNPPSEVLEQIRNMPKIELHLHLEGATQAETFYQLAQKNNVDFGAKSIEEWKNFFAFKNFNHFLSVYTLAITALKYPEDYTFIISELYRQQAEQNIIYSEVFISASFIVQKFETKEILDAIEKGIKAGSQMYDVKISFIPDISRELVDSQIKVVDFVIEGYKRGLFIGMGIGGPEPGFPPELFTAAFEKAKANGLRLVAHAGETDGPKSVWGAILKLGANRIGHGIRSLEDTKLIEYLASNKIPLEISPTSNYALGIVKKEEIHPLRKLLNAGVICCINSDDPAMFSTSLIEEYVLLLRQGFSCRELFEMNLIAMENSFADAELKSRIFSLINKFDKEKIVYESIV